ncbi:MAG: hypothetical protein IJX81_02115 [Clostridia bacterium]|nr:hypothetical protein [Clostridia bacterium]
MENTFINKKEENALQDVRKKTPTVVSVVEILLKSFVVFLFLFEFNCSVFGLPTFVTTRRVAVGIMFLHVLLCSSLKRTPRTTSATYYKKIILLQALMLAYAAILLIVIGRGSGEHVFNRIATFFLVGIFGAYIISRYFSSLEELMKTLLIACLVQAFFIVLFALVPTIGDRVDRFIGLYEGNASLNRRGYLTGFACSAAPGMLCMVPGFAACIYFILKRPNKEFFFVALFSVLVFAATMIARTGLVIGLIGLFLIWLGGGKTKKGRGIKILLMFLGIFLFGFTFIVVFGLGDKITSLFNRVVDLLREGLWGDFFAAYFGQVAGSKTVIPPISLETIVGTGILSGTSANGVTVNVDGGFVRVYTALGLPMAIISYLSLFGNSIQAARKLSDPVFKYTMIFMVAYLFVGEFKEFFLYNGLAIATFFGMLLLYDKDSIKKERERKLLNAEI